MIYDAASSSTWAINQKLGLATVTNLPNHINTSLTRLLFCGATSQQQDADVDILYDGILGWGGYTFVWGLHFVATHCTNIDW